MTGTLASDEPTRQLCELACRLDRTRHRVHVYALSDGIEPYGARLHENEVVVRCFSRRRSWETGRLRALARALRDDGIDLVHTARPAGALYGALAARLAGIATVIAVAREGERLPVGISRYLLGDAYRRATAVVANSRAYATLLATTFALPRERTRVVYDGVDVTRFHVPGRLEELRERMRPGPPVIGGFGGRATLETFLDAAARVRARESQVRFMWWSNARDRDQHERLVAVRGVPVTLRCGMDEFADELPRLAVLWVLSPADDEGRAAVLAAMAAARPVIVVRGSGLEELVAHEISGVVIERQDVDALAEHGLALLLHGARRRAVGHAARVRVEREFSLPQTVYRMAALYEEAMLGWPARPGQATSDGLAEAVSSAPRGKE